ncbi:putative undecaprenyl diphosphate synthase-domain-containing protein [Rhypophila decipiens]|uniref:Chromatin modification-related protein n=1 Tax=Rhypophila decipiens TaxID=261697 RepID=A0AAN7B715_9PEZI|nr:putative undecaprenyl diphosphate synthase-domain-containing protein [Rhypophila decipiens]
MSDLHLSRFRKWLLSSPPVELAAKCMRETLIGALRQGPIPQHVAFVMDGNRRYARNHKIETVEGHNLGFEAMARILEVCYQCGVKVVTVYAFSIENFNRPKYEVDGLMQLAKLKLEQLVQHGEILERYGARIKILGQRDMLSPDVLEVMDRAEETTKHNRRETVDEYLTPPRPHGTPFSQTRITQSLLSKHGESKLDPASSDLDSAAASADEPDQDSVSSTTTVIDSPPLKPSAPVAVNGNVTIFPNVENITAETLDKRMYTAGDPPLDLFIRTSGVSRLSDFMLWQCHQDTQIFFLNCLWPEFDLWHFLPVLTAKPPPAENSAGSSRRAQPVRQTRINPPRTSSLNRNNSLASEPVPAQPIDIFPGITHFADAITALPKELVRHFTLLKEVDAKIFTPEAALFKYVDEALKLTSPEPTRWSNDDAGSAAAASTPSSARNNGAGFGSNATHAQAPSVSDSGNPSIYDSASLSRRNMLQAAMVMKEMLVSMEEKNHVITTANEALQKQLSRIEDIWPHLEGEFSEEAKWGSDTHWAYVENRASKATQAQTERSRRDGAAALSAAAQQLAEEAAARSSDRKQALAAKKNSKAQAQAAEAEPDGKPLETGKKGPGTGKSRKAPADPAAVGLGITNPPTSNGTPAPKRRAKGTAPAAAADRAMSTVFGAAAPKPKTTSPRETPVPEPPTAGKKRKALPTSSGQAKKSRTTAAMSPSVASSPLLANFPDSARVGRNSPVPLPPQARPASSRARKNSTSTQPNGDAARQRPTSAASNNKHLNGTVMSTPIADQQSNYGRANADTKAQKESGLPIPSASSELEAQFRPEAEIPPPPPDPLSAMNGSTVSGLGIMGNNKKEASVKIEERETTRKETPALPPTPTTTVTTTKSGRASKPATPAVATFAEAAGGATMSRSRSSRNAAESKNDSTGAAAAATTTKRSHKKGASLSAAAAATAQAVAASAAPPASHDKEAGSGGKHAKDKEKDRDAHHREGSAVETGPTGKGGKGADGGLSSASSRNGPAASNSGFGSSSIVSGGFSGLTSGTPISSSSASGHSGIGGVGGSNGRNINSHAKNSSAAMAAQAAGGTTTEDDDDDADMDEQRYCFCNGVSYGEMVACDGDGCPREWFHLECVGLKVAPKGNAKWYCEDCKKRLRASERR